MARYILIRISEGRDIKAPCQWLVISEGADTPLIRLYSVFICVICVICGSQPAFQFVCVFQVLF